VKLGKTFTETLAILWKAMGTKHYESTYEMPKFSVEKLRRTNTKKMRLQKSKVKTMLIIFYDYP